MTCRTRRHPLAAIVLLAAVLVGLDLAAIVVAHFGGLLALTGVGAVVVYGYRRARRPAPPRVIQGRAESSEVGQLRAEVDQLRRQVAKLEDDAARHDQLVEDLEDAAGRPIEAIIATYRHLQRQYGPAAVGKTGRRP